MKEFDENDNDRVRYSVRQGGCCCLYCHSLTVPGGWFVAADGGVKLTVPGGRLSFTSL